MAGWKAVACQCCEARWSACGMGVTEQAVCWWGPCSCGKVTEGLCWLLC